MKTIFDNSHNILMGKEVIQVAATVDEGLKFHILMHLIKTGIRFFLIKA